MLEVFNNPIFLVILFGIMLIFIFGIDFLSKPRNPFDDDFNSEKNARPRIDLDHEFRFDKKWEQDKNGNWRRLK
ncbi:hypothetical protein [Enterococcus faecium]|uniref:hypothetical protein n=1 Tax=Enterococcus faecium TaxID=1352 RepID=UPI0008132490|nr:hypothetical protein [Enterococcus faecium]